MITGTTRIRTVRAWILVISMIMLDEAGEGAGPVVGK